MSYQPQIPILSQPPPPVAPVAKGKRHRGLLILGLLLLLGGLLGGGAIVSKGMSNYKQAVKSLARAPVGCTTTLVFDKPATFTVYTEIKGKLGDLSGDCNANGTDYNHPADKPPKVSVTLTNANGDEVDLQRGTTASYDVGGYVGNGYRTMQITQAGTYHLNVVSDETDFAVSIGKDPKADSDKLLAIGGGVALGGLVLGLLFLLLGLRRRRPEVATVADVGYTPTTMPGWPPGPYAGSPPPAPPAPQPSFRPDPPTAPQPIRLPDQPPIRVPEHPPAPAFAPPTFAPPAPPAPPVSPPTVPPPSAGPPTTAPQSAAHPPRPDDSGWMLPVPEPEDTGWTLPVKPDDTKGESD
jgi:hypothetical protein